MVGEVRMFAGNFAPAGWHFCDGALLPISENEVLFQLIGTQYGGDGQATFALPNLQSRVPVHQGTGTAQTYIMAQTGGVESVTLTTQQMPSHTHPFLVSTDTGAQISPANNVIGSGASVTLFRPIVANQPMDVQSISPSNGGNQPHDNMQPYLVINYIISLYGIYPQPN
jgi:microcystin-dependent protein